MEWLKADYYHLYGGGDLSMLPIREPIQGTVNVTISGHGPKDLTYQVGFANSSHLSINRCLGQLSKTGLLIKYPSPPIKDPLYRFPAETKILRPRSRVLEWCRMWSKSPLLGLVAIKWLLTNTPGDIILHGYSLTYKNWGGHDQVSNELLQSKLLEDPRVSTVVSP